MAGSHSLACDPTSLPTACLHHKHQTCVSLKKLQACATHLSTQPPLRHAFSILCTRDDAGGEAEQQGRQSWARPPGSSPCRSDAGKPTVGGGGVCDLVGGGHRTLPGAPRCLDGPECPPQLPGGGRSPGTSSRTRLRAAPTAEQGVAKLRRGRCRTPRGGFPPCPEDSAPAQASVETAGCHGDAGAKGTLGCTPPASGCSALACPSRCRPYPRSPALSTCFLPEPKGRLAAREGEPGDLTPQGPAVCCTSGGSVSKPQWAPPSASPCPPWGPPAR